MTMSLAAALAHLLVAQAGQDSDRIYAGLAEKYRVEFLEAQGRDLPSGFDRHPDIHWTAADADARREYARLIAEEMGRYPARLVELSGLKRVVVCADLTSQGKAVGGRSDPGTIWLNAKAENARLKRRLFHHEFFHLLEFNQIPPGGFSNQFLVEWESICGREAYDATSSAADPRKEGFINYYARKNPSEDRAEIYSMLLVMNKELKIIRSLDVKVDLKANLIQKHILISCPQIGERFWSMPPSPVE